MVASNGTGNGGGRRPAKPHAVVIAYPYQGHVIPAAPLALRLAARGFAVTFVNTESVHEQTARALGVDRHRYDIFAGARASSDHKEPLDVRYELVSDGFPLGFDRSLNHDQFKEGELHVLAAHVEDLLRRLVVDPASTCLVADTFFVWPATLAKKFGVPYVSFWTEPALIFNLYYHMDLSRRARPLQLLQGPAAEGHHHVDGLAHAALAGFLTHCGWNSVLESVWAGVPMLCFPLLTDQFTNRRLVVREWRVGVPIGDRGKVFPDEVSARIQGVISGQEGKELRQALRKVTAKLKAAAAPGGSSQRSFDDFVDELTHRCACGGGGGRTLMT
uniref:Cytokinin-N-glucosyltransferase 1 n=1 Tax=Aegilops tauschii TaxID=37682 RepID=M8CFR6_AEGTA